MQQSSQKESDLSILLVEDDDLTREICRGLLQDAFPDARIREASNGQEALALCRQRLPDLLITNVMMPRRGGIELIKALRQEGLDISTVITSGHYTAGRCEQEGIRLDGKTRFIGKPFDAGTFLGQVRAILAGGVKNV